MEEIRQWLDTANPDFNQGFALFCKYSRNQSLMSYIGRKGQMQMLVHELQKLAALPKLTPNPFYKANITQFGVSIPAKLPVEKKVEKVIVIDERKVNREDLPEEMRIIYDKIVEDYKLQRSLHEKLKMANSDAGRAEFRKKIIDLNDQIKHGWAIIDGKIPSGDQQAQTGISSQVNSARAYISKMLKKDNLTEDQRKLIMEKMKIIFDAGATLKEETLSALKAKGF